MSSRFDTIERVINYLKPKNRYELKLSEDKASHLASYLENNSNNLDPKDEKQRDWTGQLKNLIEFLKQIKIKYADSHDIEDMKVERRIENKNVLEMYVFRKILLRNDFAFYINMKTLMENEGFRKMIKEYFSN